MNRLVLVWLAVSAFSSWCHPLFAVDNFCLQVRSVCVSEKRDELFKAFNDSQDALFIEKMSSPSGSARSIVSCVSADLNGSLLVAFSPYLQYMIPDMGEIVRVNADMSALVENVLEFEQVSHRLIFLRCLTDDRFAEEYIHLVCWSGRFVQREANGYQRIAINSLLGRLEAPNNEPWRTGLQAFILARLLHFKQPEFIAADVESIWEFNACVAKFAKQHRFKLANDSLGWVLSDEGVGIDELPYLHLPSRPAKSFEVDCNWLLDE
ncbi:hypothetical protein CA13_17160 [Planctomycetes bacterium CA13]|uniref:Uncharacterized protein n=1 Tax=Novipirellula herctigrandis TaxID=2527986 RepID=A0A5C5Z0T4_9BACT|nr:hypothetical protein CA13_17160 [Planctomycetes bacterium CA13]